MRYPNLQPLPVMMVVAVGFGMGGWGLGHHDTVRADAGAGLSPAVQEAMSLQTAFGQAAEQVLPATVSIETQTAEGTATGSGFVYTADGLIMTNEHVVHGARSIKVRLAGRDQAMPASVVGADEGTDVALVSVKPAAPLPVAPLGNSDDVAVGHWAIAIGSPMDLDETVTIGVVSATGRLTGITGVRTQDFIQTDAAINPGNSGGPLVNIQGQVIGINNHIVSRSGTSAGLGFAVPINTAKVVAAQLAKGGHVTRSRLGAEVEGLDDTAIAALGLTNPGKPVRIRSVVDNSAAQAAGLRAGDVVLSIDGHLLRGAADLINRVQLTPAGQRVSLVVLRGGKQYSVDVQPRAIETVAADTSKPLGLRLITLSPRLAARLGLRATTGLVIAEVQDGSLASAAGLRQAQVITALNGKPVTNLSEFAVAWQAAQQNGETVVLTVDGKRVTLGK